MANINNLTLGKLKKKGAATNGLDRFVDHLRDQLRGYQGKSSSIGGNLFALESINESEVSQLDDAFNELDQAVESYSEQKISVAQKEAATIAGILAGAVNKWKSQSVKTAFAQEDFTTNVSYDLLAGQGPMMEKRIAAFEAYDEKENRDVVVYSMAYNMQASRQNDFGEAFYPTITVSPDNVGYDISIRLINVFNGDLKRDVSGALNDFSNRNIIRAMMDWTILRNDSTRIVPVVRAETLDKFVAPGDVATSSVEVGRETVTTAPLKTGVRFSLLGISSTPALIAGGLLDTSDAIDTAPLLKNIYIKVGTGGTADVIRYNVTGLPTNNFVSAVQGQHRQMNLNFTSQHVMLNKETKTASNGNLNHLADIVTDDVIVYLRVNMTGNLNLQYADTEVYGNSVTVVAVKDAAGNAMSLTAGTGKDIAELFATASIIGYDLEAYRTNSNRRQRGDQLDTLYWHQRYAVPLLSPISVARPVTSDGQTDTSDLGALITTTQIRASNNAVTQLINSAGMLSQYVDMRDRSGEPPELFGVGRFLVRPTYIEDTLDLPTTLDSLKSHERAKDVQANIVNKLRDIVYRMYIESGFKAASDAMNGGNSETPTVILGTDQELARYLQVDGDLRTIGPDFDTKVVHSVDDRMKGRIFVAFGYFKDQGTPNPLHFGNMLWKPELTTVLPISRNGQTSKELTVMPSFVHIVNCPVLGQLRVEGISDVIASKVNVNMDIQ